MLVTNNEQLNDELQPKLEGVFNEVNTFAHNYKTLEKENQIYQKEVNSLKEKNKKARR